MSEKAMIRPTKLKDVAKAAGVSQGTASNVFSRPELVRAEVRERVQEAARALGYSGPDPKGRLLRAGKVNAIGVVPFGGDFGVADSIKNPFARLVMQGIAEVCDEMGASLVVISGIRDHKGGGVRDAIVDGFILTRTEDLAHIEPAKLRRLPFVVMDVDAGPDISWVRVDARAGGRAAAQHLVDLGHRHFGIVSFRRDRGPATIHPPAADRRLEVAGMPIDREKYLGYREALADAGVSIDDVPIVQANPLDPAAAAMMLDVAPGATAILSMSDMQAIAVMAEARRRGFSVPHDLSVVGFNDIAEAGRANPPLTTVDGMGVAKGRAAARIVFEGGPPRQEILAARLIVRASTAPPPR